MNFELSEAQQMITKSVKDFVKKELPIERMRKLREDDTGFDKGVWRQMGELGWLGLALPEEHGGFGGGFVDAHLVLQEFGRTLVSEPYAESAVVAANCLLAGNESQHERWLAPMVAGETSLALAWAEAHSRFDHHGIATTATKVDGGYQLKGDKVWVLNGHAADHIVVSANLGDRLGLFVVDADQKGMSKTSLKTMDGRRAAHLSLDCKIEADRCLSEDGGDALARALDLGAAAACSEGVGIMRVSLGMTVEYLKTREQFGVKIGTFQALQHRAVDMFIEAELAKSTAVMAAIKVDDADADERRRAVSAAKAQLSVSGKLVTQQAIQLHGGIGVTDEHDIGLYFKRMQVLASLYGDEAFHVQRFAALPSFAA